MAELCLPKKSKPVLETIKLGKSLPSGSGPVPILFDVNLEITKGEFCAIVGHSGSGKSTLLYLLGALDTPTTGKIMIDGVDITTLSQAGLAKLRNEKLGFVFQFHYILPEFSALENVLLPMQVSGQLTAKVQRERAEMLLESLGLADRKKYYPSQLSGGQLQRVAIARALANDPLVILADEPTGNLDSKNSEIVFEFFRRQCREKAQTFVIVTHETNFVQPCDRVITIADGRIIADRIAE